MSTRSIVAIKNEDGSYDSIYCHWDGYVEGGVGDTLREEHNSEEAARALIANGDHSTIVNGCEPFGFRDDEDWADVCPQHHANEAELNAMLSESWAEYLHLFADGKWTHKGI